MKLIWYMGYMMKSSFEDQIHEVTQYARSDDMQVYIVVNSSYFLWCHLSDNYHLPETKRMYCFFMQVAICNVYSTHIQGLSPHVAITYKYVWVIKHIKICPK